MSYAKTSYGPGDIAALTSGIGLTMGPTIGSNDPMVPMSGLGTTPTTYFGSGDGAILQATHDENMRRLAQVTAQATQAQARPLTSLVLNTEGSETQEILAEMQRQRAMQEAAIAQQQTSSHNTMLLLGLGVLGLGLLLVLRKK